MTAYNAFLEDRGESPVSCTRVQSLEEVLREADVVSLHTVLDETNRHLINAERLSQMKKNAIPSIINAKEVGLMLYGANGNG